MIPRLAVRESQIEAPEPFVRRRRPVGSKCRAPPGSTAEPIDQTVTPEEKWVIAAIREVRPLGMKEREKVEFGEDHDWFLWEAKRLEPR